MRPILHVISDRTRTTLPLNQVLIEAARGGADVIQIRQKRWPAQETLTLCQELQTQIQESRCATKVFVNDRMDVALAAALDGVHLASKSLPISMSRHLADLCRWTGSIGISVHSLEEALAAEQSGAHYVTFGHIYESESKQGLAPRGIKALARIVDALSIPVIAIGGIDKSNVRPVLESGVSGVAVIGAVVGSDSPRVATEQLKEEIEKSTTSVKVPFFNTHN